MSNPAEKAKRDAELAKRLLADKNMFETAKAAVKKKAKEKK